MPRLGIFGNDRRPINGRRSDEIVGANLSFSQLLVALVRLRKPFVGPVIRPMVERAVIRFRNQSLLVDTAYRKCPIRLTVTPARGKFREAT